MVYVLLIPQSDNDPSIGGLVDGDPEDEVSKVTGIPTYLDANYLLTFRKAGRTYSCVIPFPKILPHVSSY